MKILEVIEYEYRASLNMHIMAGHVALGIFGIPEVNFPASDFKQYIQRDLMGHMI